MTTAMTTKELHGEVALVTGASRGIGRATALRLAQAGAFVILHYKSQEAQAKQTLREIEAEKGVGSLVRFDVANPEETQTALDALLKEYKKVSVLVNNAGIARDGLMLRYPLQQWDEVINTNLRSAFLVSQAVIRSMIRERKGTIVNVSSIVGVVGNAGQTAYCAAKAGLIGLTKSMAKELAPRNIRVNAVAPGFIATDMTDALHDDQKANFAAQIPLGRVGTPEEVAHAIAFLASPRSSYTTGEVLCLDGGLAI